MCVRVSCGTDEQATQKQKEGDGSFKAMPIKESKTKKLTSVGLYACMLSFSELKHAINRLRAMRRIHAFHKNASEHLHIGSSVSNEGFLQQSAMQTTTYRHISEW